VIAWNRTGTRCGVSKKDKMVSELQGVCRRTRMASGRPQASVACRAELIVRTETLVDELLCNPVDLLDTAFGDPLPTTIHMTSVLDRTQVILEQIEQTSNSSKEKWDPVVVWEPYYVGEHR